MFFLTVIYLFIFLPNVFAQKSLTVVIDTTVSMSHEIEIIYRYLDIVTNAINPQSSTTYIDNYVGVPFNYPDVQETFKTRAAEDFKKALRRLSANGGLPTECPENSLAGIQRALEISDVDSKLFVFTDADARDYEKLDTIRDLCDRTKSQVMIFLSGFCVGERDTRGLDVYRDIAAACSGMVLQFDPITLRQAFKYMKELVTENWTENKLEETFTGSHLFTISVSKQIKAVMISVTGNFPVIEITNAEGALAQLKWIVDTRYAVVVRIMDLQTTEYKINIRSRATTTVMIHSRKDFPVQFGFSTHLPRSIRETSRRPLPGRMNNILIAVPDDSDIKITTVDITYLDENYTTEIHLNYKSSKMYLGEAFFELKKQFQLNIFYTSDDNNVMKITTEVLEAQSVISSENLAIQPIVEMLDHNVVTKYGTNVTLACKVVGYPRPVVSWNENEIQNDFETVLLEMPSVYISYLTLTNVTKNGTYQCNAQNIDGIDKESVDLSVHRDYMIEFIQSPQDTIIEYGTDGKLTCEANAYPEAVLKWYHNNTEVDDSDETPNEYLSSVFTIKNMSLNNVGTYTCEISNYIETKQYSVEVGISGIELPEIDDTTSSVSMKRGESSELECRVIKGMPTPTVTWKFKAKGTYDFGEVPFDIYQKDRMLQFSYVKPEYDGVYRCEASNMAGMVYQDIYAAVLYAPIFKEEKTIIKIREGEEVVLPCEVEANPEATVHWEKLDDFELVTLENTDKCETDECGTLRFDSRWNDSGEYSCVAENEVGKSKSTIDLEVLVRPYIEPPSTKMIVVRRGQSVTIPCVVAYGNPVPKLTWEIKLAERVVFNDVVPLHFDQVAPFQEGFYTCIATNSAGTDSIKIYLRVI